MTAPAVLEVVLGVVYFLVGSYVAITHRQFLGWPTSTRFSGRPTTGISTAILRFTGTLYAVIGVWLVFHLAPFDIGWIGAGAASFLLALQVARVLVQRSRASISKP